MLTICSEIRASELSVARLPWPTKLPIYGVHENPAPIGEHFTLRVTQVHILVTVLKHPRERGISQH